MGYRYRLGKISKIAHKHYKNMSEQEINKEIGEDKSVYRELPEYSELYELGKYIQFDFKKVKFFNFDLPDTEFWIINKEILKNLIEMYHNNVFEYYKNLYDIVNDKSFVDDKSKYNQLVSHFYGIKEEWNTKWNLRPYYLDQDKTDGMISGSWKLEYAIFNLTYIYRAFDFKKDLLIYSAW